MIVLEMRTDAMYRAQLRAIQICKIIVCLAMLTLLGTLNETHAANSMTTITVVSRLVLWAKPTLNSSIVAVLRRGRHFSVNGRSASGRWIHGMTDKSVVGCPALDF